MTTNSTNCKSGSQMLALLATTLLLMLSCGGCVRSRLELQPSIHQGPLGNSILTRLPVGTVIQPPAVGTNNLGLLWPFANEMNGYVTTQPLMLCTPAYIAERDAAEIELHKTINALRK
jgi:hypothetical protein